MNRKSKSINRRIVITFLLIMAVMSSSFLYSNFMKNNIVEQYNVSMRTNIKFSDLSVDFNNSWVNFDSYIKSQDTNTYEKFTELNRKIESLLKELEVYAKQDKNSFIYFRTLTNMFELYKEQTSSVIAKEKLDIETYEQYVRLGRMNFYMSQNSRNLTSAYLQFTDSYYSNILDKYKIIDTNLYLLLVFAIFTCAFLIWAVNHGVFDTINKISVSVKLLSNSNWDIPDIEEQPYKELDNFTKTFNHMKNSIREYINQLNQKAEIEKNYHLERIKSAEKDKLIKDTQLKTLQMQVNPHFLFNNLNTVSRMAMFEEADKTVDLIGALSKILRYNLVSIDKLVKLSEEIESVKAYILIQKTKYEDRVCFEFNIDKEIEDIKIPPMIIQLLVENSIIHGLSGLDRDGIIKVEGLKDGNFAIITVEDNGVGMTEADEKIRDNKTTTGLGLANIRRRLELYYSRQDLLTIKSSLGKGTKVCITIPLKDGEDIDESINS